MIEGLLDRVMAWASSRRDLRAVVLVGSHARGTARPDSDVDLMLLTERPRDLTDDLSWVNELGTVDRLELESWGRVTSVRAWYAGGPEVEFSLATPDWVKQPDEGTRRVLGDGYRVLLDRDEIFSARRTT